VSSFVSGDSHRLIQEHSPFEAQGKQE